MASRFSKKIWVDTETTGTDPQKNSIIELCGIIEIDGKEVERFDFKVQPYAGSQIAPEALQVTGKTESEIQNYPSQDKVYREFIQIIEHYVNRYDKADKFEWFGYNAKFDMDFVREFFNRNLNKYFGSYFWSPPIDVWLLAVYAQREHRAEFTSTKLWDMAQWYGLDLAKRNAHSAMDDIEVTRELFDKVVSAMKSSA